MSNPYLERLRGRAEEKTETQHPSQPSKPPKPSFDSFGGDQSMCFFENEAAEEESENLKNASPRDRQNRQNLDLPAEPNAAYRATSVGRMVSAARSRLSSCRRRRATGRPSAFSNSGLRPWSRSSAGRPASGTEAASSPSGAIKPRRWAGRRRTYSASTPRQSSRMRAIAA